MPHTVRFSCILIYFTIICSFVQQIFTACFLRADVVLHAGVMKKAQTLLSKSVRSRDGDRWVSPFSSVVWTLRESEQDPPSPEWGNQNGALDEAALLNWNLGDKVQERDSCGVKGGGNHSGRGC